MVACEIINHAEGKHKLFGRDVKINTRRMMINKYKTKLYKSQYGIQLMHK